MYEVCRVLCIVYRFSISPSRFLGMEFSVHAPLILILIHISILFMF